MNEREFINMVKTEMDRIDNSFIYYPLREYGVKRIAISTIEVIKCCLVIEKVMPYITIKIVSTILDRDDRTTLMVLRGLGDKNILDLKGYIGNALAYKINDSFKKLLKIEVKINE